MSSFLWKFYLDDDVDTFRQLLADAAFVPGPHDHRAIHGAAGNSGELASSVASNGGKSSIKNRRHVAKSPASEKRNCNWSGLTLTRADVNLRDGHGLTILHYAASSSSQNAVGFATALIYHPLIDLYVQDEENGWTALHRALYFGNVTIARAVMDRDRRDASSHSNLSLALHPGGVIKMKDKDGNSAFDVFNASITNWDLGSGSFRRYTPCESNMEHGWCFETDWSISSDDCGSVSYDVDEELIPRELVDPRVNIEGDEVYTFGSNKNFNLGFADEDDRQFPDRISLERPDHKIRNFYLETWRRSSRVGGGRTYIDSEDVSRLPFLIRNSPLAIRDVVLSKLHTAILTTDDEENLYVCGYGPGGRLGTGDENTRFTFVPIHGGNLSRTRTISIALGQNHTVASTREGEVFTWGTNTHGQLGYTVSKPNMKDELVQLLPRQVYGALKREAIVGTGASSIHSVVYSKYALFTFGKNEGQLGLTDSDARSLEIQPVPRRVGASLFSSRILMVSAIDRATVCLLDNHDVWVFANYGYARVAFPLHGSGYDSLKQGSFFPWHVLPDHISRITSGGDTICAKSRMGDLFTIKVNQSEPGPSDSLVANTSRARRVISQPQRIWSPRKGYMAVRDIGVGQDGSIILCTESGSVWRRIRRSKVDAANSGANTKTKLKDYKFTRVPGLTGVVAVRCNTFGAYAAVRKDNDILRTRLQINSGSLRTDICSLLSFHDLGNSSASTGSEKLKLGSLTIPESFIKNIERAVLMSADLASDLSASVKAATTKDSSYNLYVRTTTSDTVIPTHRFIFLGRSPALRKALARPRLVEPSAGSECFTIEATAEGKLLITFQGFDFLVILNLVLYVYTDQIIDFWDYAQSMPTQAIRFRQVRMELMKLATCLGLMELETAVRGMRSPLDNLSKDLACAVPEKMFWDDGDIVVELSGAERRVHSALVCQRCPFFAGLFKGHAAGKWLSSRRQHREGRADPISIDLKHVEPDAFDYVLRHLYLDEEEVLFAELVTSDLDEFLDMVTEVMSVANELMIERLCQICQKLLGRFVTIRNVCQLLNAVAPCSVTAFKDMCFEYICSNMEGMLENHILDDLDEELMLELDEVVRNTQLSYLPFSKSGKAETLLQERFPNLVEARERERRAWVDELTFSKRRIEQDGRPIPSGSSKANSTDTLATSSSHKRTGRRVASTETKHDASSSMLRPRNSTVDLIFFMDEDDEGGNRAMSKHGSRPTDQLPPLSTRSHADRATIYGEVEVLHRSDLRSQSAIALSDQSSSAAGTLAALSSLEKSTNSVSQSTTTPASPSTPWRSAPLISDKLDLKEIMAQTLPTRSSNTSSGISAQTDNAHAKTVSSFGGKVSQRERKKQQQQTKEHVSSPPVPMSTQSLPEGHATSPWAIPITGQKISLKEVLEGEKLASEAGRPSLHSSHSPETKGFDVRKLSGLNQPGENPRRTQQRAVSSPSISGTGGKSVLGKSPAQPLSTSPMHPETSTASKSVDCSPTQARARASQPRTAQVEPALQLSMADIMSQQQAQEEIVRQTVSRRPLADIQQEQEFMEWWDAESRKVRGEESARGEGSNKESERSHGRGGRRRRGKGMPRGRGC